MTWNWWYNRRYATLPGIMKAKKKPMEKKKLADFNVDFKKRLETLEVVGIYSPPLHFPLPLIANGTRTTPTSRRRKSRLGGRPNLTIEGTRRYLIVLYPIPLYLTPYSPSSLRPVDPSLALVTYIYEEKNDHKSTTQYIAWNSFPASFLTLMFYFYF